MSAYEFGFGALLSLTMWSSEYRHWRESKPVDLLWVGTPLVYWVIVIGRWRGWFA